MDSLYLLSLRSALRDVLLMPQQEREEHLRGIIDDLDRRIAETAEEQKEVAMLRDELRILGEKWQRR